MLYISGPMSGIEGFNLPAFNDVEGVLKDLGHEVINPAKNFNGETHHPREEYMRVDVQHVLQAEGVVVLQGWETSRGANTELRVALEIGLPIYQLPKIQGRCPRHPLVEVTNQIRQVIFGEEVSGTPSWQIWEKKEGIRTFETGATRDTDEGKLDYEGFLSPLVLKRFAEYMHKNRFLKDGSMRDSDNWQLGISRDVYMKSLWRHFMDVWSSHRGWTEGDDHKQGSERIHERSQERIQEELCAMLFNVQGYLHEILKKSRPS